MPNDWTPRLHELLQLLTAGEASPNETRGQIHINLGIDFGTSFTKACFRDVGAERSGIVQFRGASISDAIVPSVVQIDDHGRLFIPNTASPAYNRAEVRYLKMRLAGKAVDGGQSVVPGHDINDPEVNCALSAWFLSKVIQVSQNWIYETESERLINRKIVWSANIGVPVEHYDSDIIAAFREVFGVVWQWVQNNQIPANLQSLLSVYSETKGAAANSDCHAVPEIAAAVQSFVISREAIPGIYIYFDMGGGTVDGVAFSFSNDGGERRIDFYSGKVAPLGVAVLLNAVRLDKRIEIAPDIAPADLRKLLQDQNGEWVSHAGKCLQRLVGEVILTAKKKDNRSWEIDAQHGLLWKGKRIGRLEPSQMRPLVVFLGGGGSRINWYELKIAATYHDFQHFRAGIPPYKLVEVPKPKDLEMGRISAEEFRRFAIAYGLSIPFGEGPDIGLPSQFKNAPPPPSFKPKHLVSYEDSKDAYD